ncbi:hypothetical protein Tco_0650467 [Tanacetum coccineum]
MSQRSNFCLGLEETFGSDEVFDPSAPSIFDTTPKDVAEKPLYDRFVKAVGMHAVPPPITGTFMPPSNNPDLDDNSDKSSDSETTGFASCISSVKSSSSKTNEPLASAPSLVAFQTMSETADQQLKLTTNDASSFSFKGELHFCCVGSKFPLIKDNDFYEKQIELHNKPMWNNVTHIPSFVPKAASVPAGSRNRPTSVRAGSRNTKMSLKTKLLICSLKTK